MDALTRTSPAQLHLLTIPRRAARKLLSVFIARLALSGAVKVLDCGNLFDFHIIARAVRQHTLELEPALRRISIARAFTCYQVEALLCEQGLETDPVVVLDLLSSFADENVALVERQRLLALCINHLRRVARLTQVLVSVTPPSAPDDSGCLERLSAAADQVWQFQQPETPSQPMLW